MKAEFEELVTEIQKIAKKAFLDLFANGETYYYCTLITTGEAHFPHVTAWSLEALAEVMEEDYPDDDVLEIKWLYAESPYMAWKYEEYFENSPFYFGGIPYELTDEDYNKEYDFRLSAMEEAMKRLDEEGIFALNQPRCEVYVNVETVDPDDSDFERLLRLNNRADLKKLLKGTLWGDRLNK